ncbi:MAG TPA: (4Fe-4S)-binding protein [Planctomycetaceae bacterium]|nr:(4Fe-4S)-binding protein [Planctomycetaceae bacterium]
MQIAIASGKGGTGKTTVATNLAYVASRRGLSVAYLDCDVEAPNGHIFLRPQITERETVGNLVPQVDHQRCTLCGRCGEICQYSAIALVGQQVLVYPELCHGCGGCWLVCPEKAITEVSRPIGVVETGQAGSIQFARGLLNVGEPMSPPVIRAVKAVRFEAEVTVIDAPPGTSCPVIESLRGADFVLLVTEPTPFGLHDLKLAVEMVRALKLPFGVVINRATEDGRPTRSFCEAQRVAILAEIPDDRKLAEAYARGVLACDFSDRYRTQFSRLLESARAPGKESA